MRKGITPLVATVLIVVITILVAVIAYIFTLTTQQKVQVVTQESTTELQEDSSYCLSIENIYFSNITLRNCGTRPVGQNNLALYINGTSIHADLTSLLLPQEAGVVAVRDLESVEGISPGRAELQIIYGAKIRRKLTVDITIFDQFCDASGQVKLNFVDTASYNRFVSSMEGDRRWCFYFSRADSDYHLSPEGDIGYRTFNGKVFLNGRLDVPYDNRDIFTQFDTRTPQTVRTDSSGAFTFETEWNVNFIPPYTVYRFATFVPSITTESKQPPSNLNISYGTQTASEIVSTQQSVGYGSSTNIISRHFIEPLSATATNVSLRVKYNITTKNPAGIPAGAQLVYSIPLMTNEVLKKSADNLNYSQIINVSCESPATISCQKMRVNITANFSYGYDTRFIESSLPSDSIGPYIPLNLSVNITGGDLPVTIYWSFQANDTRTGGWSSSKTGGSYSFFALLKNNSNNTFERRIYLSNLTQWKNDENRGSYYGTYRAFVYIRGADDGYNGLKPIIAEPKVVFTLGQTSAIAPTPSETSYGRNGTMETVLINASYAPNTNYLFNVTYTVKRSTGSDGGGKWFVLPKYGGTIGIVPSQGTTYALAKGIGTRNHTYLPLSTDSWREFSIFQANSNEGTQIEIPYTSDRKMVIDQKVPYNSTHWEETLYLVSMAEFINTTYLYSTRGQTNVTFTDRRFDNTPTGNTYTTLISINNQPDELVRVNWAFLSSNDTLPFSFASNVYNFSQVINLSNATSSKIWALGRSSQLIEDNPNIIGNSSCSSSSCSGNWYVGPYNSPGRLPNNPIGYPLTLNATTRWIANNPFKATQTFWLWYEKTYVATPTLLLSESPAQLTMQLLDGAPYGSSVYTEEFT